LTNAVHSYPHFNLWKNLDPTGKNAAVYNRYAHVLFWLSSDRDNIKIVSPQAGVIDVSISAYNPALAQLGVDYLLFVGQNPSAFDAIPFFNREYSSENKHIYSVIRG